MLSQRAEAAGLEYYNPHSFRHLTAHLVLPKARTPEQWQAIKQNFGHKFLATTMDCYGRLTPGRQGDVIANFDFDTRSSGEGAGSDDNELLARLKQAGIRLDILR
jgi:integrase